MKLRKWRRGGTTYVEVSASNVGERGMPAVLAKTEGDARVLTVQLTTEWDNAVKARRELNRQLKAARMNVGKEKS